jgi:glutamyl-Q tRNA(Asp) synthetase
VSYVGRFAPSPTGPLHLGSLATAVASYLHARQAAGQWLVRIEDIDPPREVPGAADDILRTLEAFGLQWDGGILRQSTRLATYRAAAEQLLAAGRAFRCECSRATVRAANDTPSSGRYPGTCRTRRLEGLDTAIRVLVADSTTVDFVDGLQGAHSARLDLTTGDYLVLRRDGLPAYHLAVVLDDAAQGVTTIVRGIDLLDSTAAHIHLQRTLALPTPAYWHLPVVVNADGQKLSKQTGAEPISAAREGTAAQALGLLGLDVPKELRREPAPRLWEWALRHWRIEALRGRLAIPAAPFG